MTAKKKLPDKGKEIAAGQSCLMAAPWREASAGSLFIVCVRLIEGGNDNV